VSLRQRLAAWIFPELVARAFVPPGYVATAGRTGISNTENQPTPDALLTQAVRGTQATAARAISRRIGDLEFMVTKRTRSAMGEAEYVEIPSHPLVAVLERPNPLLTRLQLLRILSWWITQTGEAYILKVTNGAGAVRELWPMSPRSTEKIQGKSAPVEGFVFHGEQGETTYRLDEVVWIYDPDPAYPFRGLGIIGPQSQQFDSSTFAQATLREHYQNDATPKTVLIAGEDARLPETSQRTEFEKDWWNRYSRQSGTARNTPAFLPSGFKIQELSGGAQVADTQAFLAYMRDDLLMANGVPRSILGDVVDANRAAAETNQFVFDRHTIQPQANLIADAMTYQLAQPDYGPETFIRFREFIAGDQDLRLREEQQDLAAKVRTINEVRSARGLENVEWGDLPIGSFADVPYTGDDPTPNDTLPPQPGEPAPSSVTDGEDPGDPGEPTDPTSSGRAHPGAPFTVAASWARVMQADRQFVPLMVSRLRRVFAAQRALVLEALAAPERSSDLAAWSRADGLLDELFAGGDFARLFDVLVTPVHIDAANASRQSAMNLLGAKPTLSFNDAAVRLLRKQGAELVAQVNGATKRKIRKTLADGTAAGESLDDLSSRVRRVFKEANDVRARTIARTEVGRATQFGQLEGYQDSGVVVGKRWNTSQDSRVRDSHEIDGTAVALTETFTLPGDGKHPDEQADAPGIGAEGTTLSAANSINCRCFLTPVLEGDL
jgi:phage portal protein BeeE